MRILIIDDEASSAGVLSQQLEGLGTHVIETLTTPDAALETLRTRGLEFDAVFCDVHMREMDGVELVRNMSQLSCHHQVVLISEESERTMRAVARVVEAYELNLGGALTKPVTTDALRALLADMANKHSQAPAETLLKRKRYTARELHNAIVREELYNAYQPKVSLSTGELVGVEALVRWRHLLDGLIYPDQFVPLAEQSGLVQALSQRVIQSACNDIKRWQSANLHVPVAINLSMENLMDYRFPEQLSTQLDRAGVAAELISLEITESRLAYDDCMPLDVLTRLRLRGFKLSLDDYGTGHSSLSRLRDLPFDEMKFDRSFVHNVNSNLTLNVMLQSNVAMARQLDLHTVAEGVNDIEDWHILRACGVDVAQGYFVEKPMAAENLPEWYVEWQQRVIDEKLNEDTP